MHELICPNCGKPFRVDEAGYASILSQVRGAEFDAEVSKRLAELHRQQQAEQKARLAEADTLHQRELFQKDKALSEKDREIERLKFQISSQEDRKQLEIKEALAAKELAMAQERQKARDAVLAREAEITRLKADAELEKSRSSLHEKSIREDYENRLKVAGEQVAYYKDLKTRMSTKMVGETLETHCSTIFNGELRPLFPNAYFEKDNDASSGSKGDFIFRDYEDGTEYISIMFEMKNEMETTATKHKNEDFFKELDKDRTEKGCEYAVLVSLLEADNELYNNGIVDVSYRYPKMYVIRPQFFIPMITLLRNAALNSLQYQKELAVVRNQQLDLYNFETNMQEFKDAFGRNYRIASEKFQTAIEEIDKTIDHLEKVKKALQSSENNLRLANDKADDLSIKKLTRNAPSVRKMFDDLDKDGE